MKLKLMTGCALSLALISFNNYASETTMNTDIQNIEKATYITLESKPEAAAKLEAFLQKGSQLVRQTEPGTPLWFGLRENNNFAIFDLFYNDLGREKHFAGQVANALKVNAPELVDGGWEQGVVENINNFDVVATNHFNKERVLQSKVANLITFKAKSGKSQELELFLQDAAKSIDATEPGTYLWLALKMDKDTYAIFDSFQDQESQKAHFVGLVAEKLKAHASDLIAKGWDEGVVANIHSFQIIALS